MVRTLLIGRLLFCLLLLAASIIAVGAPAGHWRLLKTIRADDWGTAPIAVSPDGHLLASCTTEEVVVRDLVTGRVRYRLLSSQSSCSALFFSPDGHLLVLASGPAAFSPDGKVLAMGSGTTARLCDIRTGRVQLARSSTQDNFTLWDVTRALPLWSVPSTTSGYWSLATALAFSPDGRTVAAGSAGGGLQIWRAADGILLRTLTGPPATWRGASIPARRGGVLAHPGRVVALAFSPDGASLVSAGGDGSVRVWSPATGALLRIILSPEGVQGLAFLPSGRMLVAAFRRDLAELDLSSGRIVRTLHGHDEDVQAIAISPNGSTLWSGANDGTIKCWNLTQGIDAATYGHIQQIAVSGDGTMLAFSLGDRNITVQDVSSGKVRGVLQGFSRPERSGSFSHSFKTLVFSRDGRLLAGGAFTTEGFVDHSGVFHSRVILWRTKSAKILHLWDEEPAAQLTFTPGGGRLVEMTSDLTDTPSSLRIRSVPQGRLIREWRPHNRLFRTQVALGGAAPVFSQPDRLLLATTGLDPFGGKTMSGLWDVMTGRFVRVLNHEGVPRAERDGDGTPSFSTYDATGSGHFVVGVGTAGLTLWDSLTGLPRWTRPPTRGQVETGATVSADGRWVAGGEGPDGGLATPVFIREGRAGRTVARLYGPGNGLIWLGFSLNGRRLLAASRDGAVHIWGFGLHP